MQGSRDRPSRGTDAGPRGSPECRGSRPRDAGCLLVEILEPAATQIGDDEAERRNLSRGASAADRRARRAASLARALWGECRHGRRARRSSMPRTPSYAFDLVAGPDNWRLIADVPGERGVICGALSPAAGADDGPELLVWAAHYAASTRGRGIDRVGLANAPGLDGLAWEASTASSCGWATRHGSPRREDGRAGHGPRPARHELRSAALGRHSHAAAATAVDEAPASWACVLPGHVPRPAASSTRRKRLGWPGARPGFRRFVDIHVAGRRTGRTRSHAPRPCLTVGEHRLHRPPERPRRVGSQRRRGRRPSSWSRPTARGSASHAVRLCGGPEREAIIRATWSSSRFPPTWTMPRPPPCPSDRRV